MFPIFRIKDDECVKCFNLVVICRNKRQAKDLYERTYSYLSRLNHPLIYGPSKNILYVKDMAANESARFVTVYELKHKYSDEDLDGIRLFGDFFDKWLDQEETKSELTYEACMDALFGKGEKV